MKKTDLEKAAIVAITAYGMSTQTGTNESEFSRFTRCGNDMFKSGAKWALYWVAKEFQRPQTLDEFKRKLEIEGDEKD